MDLLIIEDDVCIQEMLQLGWPSESDTLRFVSTYRQSMKLIHSAELRFFDAIVVDVGLPDGNGLTILQGIREHSDTPVILTSGTADAESRASSIEMGADDHLTKPFSIRELHARIARLVSVRAARNDSHALEPFMVGRVQCDPQGRVLTIGRDSVALTDAEARIMGYLHDHVNSNCGKPAIYKNVFFRHYDPAEKTLDVYISRLRRKLEDLEPGTSNFIQTARGLGYRLNGS